MVTECLSSSSSTSYMNHQFYSISWSTSAKINDSLYRLCRFDTINLNEYLNQMHFIDHNFYVFRLLFFFVCLSIPVLWRFNWAPFKRNRWIYSIKNDYLIATMVRGHTIDVRNLSKSCSYVQCNPVIQFYFFLNWPKQFQLNTQFLIFQFQMCRDVNGILCFSFYLSTLCVCLDHENIHLNWLLHHIVHN